MLLWRCPGFQYLQPGHQLEMRGEQGALRWGCSNEPASLSALLLVPVRLQGPLLLYFLKWHQVMAVKSLLGENELLGQHFMSRMQGFIGLTLY